MRKSTMIGNFVEEYKDRFATTLICGTPISELNEDELRGCICFLAENNSRDFAEVRRQRNFMAGLREQEFKGD